MNWNDIFEYDNGFLRWRKCSNDIFEYDNGFLRWRKYSGRGVNRRGCIAGADNGDGYIVANKNNAFHKNHGVRKP